MSDMKFKLSDEQRALVGTVRDLVRTKFSGRVMKWQDGTFPWENMHDLAKIGVLGMSIPEEYGGSGLPVFDTALVLEEVAKVCYATSMALMGEVGVQARVICHLRAREHEAGHPAQGVLRRIAARGVHDRAARRHRRRELSDQHDDQGRPRDGEGRQDADQPGRRSRVVRRVQPHRRHSPAATASAACWSIGTRRDSA